MKKILTFLFIGLLVCSIAIAGTKEDLLALINAERASLGRGPLTFDSRLNTASQGHSDDQLANDYFSHYSLDNRSPFDRMAAAGYTGPGGENIAWHSGGPDAQHCYDMWEGSTQGHYENMVNSAFNIAGIGISDGNWDLPPYSNLYSTVYVLNLGYSATVCSDGETRQCGLTSVGVCEYGTETCTGGTWGSCAGAVYPSAEICDDGLDNDCDGATDGEDSDCCISQDSFACYNYDVYWYDSCDNREDKKQECYTNGCIDGACVVCDSHANVGCYYNDVYWYNSCGVREDKKDECAYAGCVSGECCDSHSGYVCYNGDVYWHSSCNYIEEKKEDCIDGCVEGVCVICDEHDSYACYNNDVYWYDSCDRREEKKEECGSYGCTEDECNPPPCGDNDKDGYVDIECGGDDCDDTNKQVYPGSVEICNEIDEDCNDIIDDGCKENLIILSPEQNSEFNTRRVLIELGVTHLNGAVQYDIGTGWRTFCTNILRCSRYLSVPEGDNQINFKLLDFSDEEYKDSLNIFVDSIKPRISRQYPKSRGYANGEFTVIYTEDYPETVDLYLAEPGSEEFVKVASTTECGAGRNVECTLEYDVLEFDGEQIKYYFEVSDRASITSGRAYTANVDTTDPEFTSFSFDKISETSERYLLNTEMSEYVKLEYQYPGIAKKILCSKCSYKRVTFYFRTKPEYVDFFAIDMAGNTAEDMRVYLE